MKLFFLIALSTLVAFSAPAATSKKTPVVKQDSELDPPIAAGTQITVLRFDRATRTLIVKINDEPEVGPNIATPENLADAIQYAEVTEKKKYVDEPQRFVGPIFTLKKDLKLIANVEGGKRVPKDP